MRVLIDTENHKGEKINTYIEHLLVFVVLCLSEGTCKDQINCMVMPSKRRALGPNLYQKTTWLLSINRQRQKLLTYLWMKCISGTVSLLNDFFPHTLACIPAVFSARYSDEHDNLYSVLILCNNLELTLKMLLAVDFRLERYSSGG